MFYKGLTNIQIQYLVLVMPFFVASIWEYGKITREQSLIIMSLPKTLQFPNF